MAECLRGFYFGHVGCFYLPSVPVLKLFVHTHQIELCLHTPLKTGNQNENHLYFIETPVM